MTKVTHVITGLDVGGAETALWRLIEATDREEFDLRVISLTVAGEIAARIAGLGVPVTALGMTPTRFPLVFVRLWRELRRTRPAVVQTWMYHGDVLGGVAARLARVNGLAWNLRSSDLAAGAWSRSTEAVARWEARLSRRLPDAIVCGSEAALRFHRGLGFPVARMTVIPNGFAVPPADPAARDGLRTELGIGADAVLVGRVARFHPHKDHVTLLRATGLVMRRHPEVHLVLCGEGVDPSNAELASLVQQEGIEGRVHLLGPRSDVDHVHAGLDVACSSSLGEGFPNVVAEAMAAGVPVVVTDVGDSALLVGSTGRIVPPRDSAALAAAITELVELGDAGRRSLGAAARHRIAESYGLDVMAERYALLHRQLADRGAA